MDLYFREPFDQFLVDWWSADIDFYKGFNCVNYGDELRHATMLEF